MVNKAIVLGRIGNDPDLRYTASGKAVANFSVATTERWKDSEGTAKEQTQWHRIVVWGKQAETIKEYFSKGSRIYLEGKLQTKKYDDKEGITRYTTEIVLQSFSFIDSKKERAEVAGNEEPTTEPEKAPPETPDEEDLPF